MSDLTLSVGFDIESARKDIQQIGQDLQQELARLNISPQTFQMYAAHQGMQQSAQTTQATRGLQNSAAQIANSVQQLVGSSQQTAQSARNVSDTVHRQQTPGGVVHGRYGSYERGDHQTAGRMTHAINTLSGVVQGGASTESVMRGIGSMLAMFGPYGQVAAATLNLAAAGAEREKQTGSERLRLYRSGGNEARSLFHETTNMAMAGSEFSGWKRGSMQALGLTKNEVANIIATLSKDTGSLKAVWDVAKLEAGYGLGGGAMGVLKSVAGQGGDTDRRVLAQTMGVYFAQALERGRVGEAFSFVSKMVSGGTQGIPPNMSEVGKTAEFIGGMGIAYRGDTGASNQALGALRGLATGEGGGVSKMFALRASGLGGGSDYWRATMESSKGLEQGGSNVTRRVISQYADKTAIKSAWFRGDRAKAAVLFSMLSGNTVKPYLAEKLLESYYAGHGADDVTEGREAQINNVFEDTKLPEKDRAAIDDENRKSWLLERDAYHGNAVTRTTNDTGGRALEHGGASSGMPAGGFSSVAAIKDSFGSNYGQERSNEIKNGQYVPGIRTHDAEDMALPPGSPVYVAVGGRVRSVGQAMADTAYGYYIEIEGDDGRLYKYVHLASKPSVPVNSRIREGTFLGHTMKNSFPGGGKSHLHLSIKDKAGKSLSPYKAMSLSAFNRMLGAPDIRMPSWSVGAKAAQDSGAGASVAGGNAPTSMQDAVAAYQRDETRNKMHLVVEVKDSRVSVSRRATRGTASGGHVFGMESK